ncbi:hypothetical protein BYT27DRAFT_7241289 [Phlegmacium glaucopus]|nr:hypothetical protein BYT27DRAFT_7241289 [Phlegmacium glaucopus]
MDCKICEFKQRHFYCEICLKTHLHDFRQQTHHYALDRDDQVSKAVKALSDTITPARLSRAGVSAYQRQVDELQIGLAKLRRENDRKRDRLRTLRETLASRRRTISAAKLQANLSSSHIQPPSPSLSPSPYRDGEALSNLSSMIARARSGLVQELVEVFNVVEVGGRPPIGGKAGTKGEWTIGDLILPVPGDMRRYPPDHINAVLTHTIHFISLLTFYLGVKLPFEVIWTGGKLGVGQPWIGATQGSEVGGWARWYTKHPLHLSSSWTPSSPPASITNSMPKRFSRSQSSPQQTSEPLAASIIAADPPVAAPESSFTTALSMLLYDVSYLAYTQTIDVPLSQAGDVLSNLWTVCCSSELGRKSHETYPHLPAPTPPSFPLDFSQLLQATVAHPPSRPRKHRSGPGSIVRERIEEASKEEEEGWDLVDDDV